MDPVSSLIPPPAVVEAQLAQHDRDRRILRALYRLSVRAALSEQGRRPIQPAASQDTTPSADRRASCR